MKRLLILLLLVAPAAFAQTVVVKNCVSLLCTVVTNPAPPLPAVQPVTCKLFEGTTVLATLPVVGVPPYCQWVRNFTAGRHTITATWLAADGSESGHSSPFVFDSSLGPPAAPTGLRIQ